MTKGSSAQVVELYDGAQIAKVVGVAGKSIPSDDLMAKPDNSPTASGVTAADELFFNLDGRIFSTANEEWRLEVCGIYTEGTQHWVQLNVHGAVGCGLTLHTESLDAAPLLRRVDAWLSLVAKTGEPSLCTIGD